MRDSLDWVKLAEKWDFAAAMSSRLAHDLSNIFTGVTGFAELAQFQLPADHPARGHLKDLLTAGSRGIELTARMHLVRTCGNVQPGPGTVGPAVEHAVARLPHTAGGIDVSLPADLPAVRLGPEPLRVALGQFLTNAVEAAPAAKVAVTAVVRDVDAAAAPRIAGAVAAGPHVVVDVADAGRGIPADLIGKLLEVPIVSTKSGPRGMGIGIAFRTLYAHGGGFELLAGSAGGTVARVYLPVA